jgi:hypothetical protein
VNSAQSNNVTIDANVLESLLSLVKQANQGSNNNSTTVGTNSTATSSTQSTPITHVSNNGTFNSCNLTNNSTTSGSVNPYSSSTTNWYEIGENEEEIKRLSLNFKTGTTLPTNTDIKQKNIKVDDCKLNSIQRDDFTKWQTSIKRVFKTNNLLFVLEHNAEQLVEMYKQIDDNMDSNKITRLISHHNNVAYNVIVSTLHHSSTKRILTQLDHLQSTKGSSAFIVGNAFLLWDKLQREYFKSGSSQDAIALLNLFKVPQWHGNTHPKPIIDNINSLGYQLTITIPDFPQNN